MLLACLNAYHSSQQKHEIMRKDKSACKGIYTIIIRCLKIIYHHKASGRKPTKSQSCITDSACPRMSHILVTIISQPKSSRIPSSRTDLSLRRTFCLRGPSAWNEWFHNLVCCDEIFPSLVVDTENGLMFCLFLLPRFLERFVADC